MSEGKKRLWEVSHPYYCSESNYYVGGVPRREMPVIPPFDPERERADFVPFDHVRFDSWEDFDWKDADPDYNLLFRWDWVVPDPDDYDEGESVPPERLELFWMLQRKGRFMVTSFPVLRSEEPEIRMWLADRFKTVLAIWEPFSTPPLTVKGSAYTGAPA